MTGVTRVGTYVTRVEFVLGRKSGGECGCPALLLWVSIASRCAELFFFFFWLCRQQCVLCAVCCAVGSVTVKPQVG